MIYIRLFLLLLLLPFNAYSNSNIENIEKCLQDVSKRYVLATHGVDALQSYDIDCADYSKLKEYNDTELEAFTAPFNPNTTSLLDLVILVVNYVGIAYLSVLVIQLLGEGIDNTQSTGELLGKSKNTVFTFMKIAVAIALIVPFKHPYNLAQLTVFKAVGYSNIYAKDIVNAMVSNQPRTFPSLKMPNSDNKQLEMARLIQFMTCVKSEPTVKANQISLNFYRENGLVKAASNYGRCFVNVQIGLDKYTPEIIERSSEIKSLLGNSIDYNEVQYAMFQKLFTELLKQADKVSEVLVKPVEVVRKESNEFDSLVVGKHANRNQIVHWEMTCPDVINYVPKRDLTKTEKEQYLYLASRCMSYTATQRLVYPYDNPEITKYFKTENYLQDNNIELCAHDYNVSTTIKTVIKETSAEIDTSNLNFSFSMKQKSAKQCLIEACSNLNGDNSNAYICANAIFLYDTLEKNKIMAERGFMTLGAYMYQMFTGLQTSESAKSIFNNLKINYINQPNALGTPHPDDILFTVYQSFTPVLHDKMLAYLYTEMPSVDILNYKRDFNAIEGKYGDLVSNSNGVDFLGSNRFVECINKPLRVSNGYACSSTSEEIHHFGKNILKSALFIKTITASAGMRKKMTNSFGKKKVSGEGYMNNLTSKLKASPLGFMLDSALFGLINIFFGGDQTQTDEFGNFDSNKQNDQQLQLERITGNGIALLAISNSGSFLSDLIDTVLNFLIVLGLVMAYGLPLMPLILWLLVLLSFFTMFIGMIIVMPLWIPSIVKIGQQYFNDFERRGLAITFTIVLKIPLYCIALGISWFLMNTVGGELLKIFSVSDALNSEYGFSVSVYIDMLIAIFVYSVLLLYILNKCVTLIEVFADTAIGFLEGDINLRQLGQDRSEGLISTVGSGIKTINPKS